MPHANKLSNADLYKQLEADLKEYGAQEVKVGQQLQVATATSTVLLQDLNIYVAVLCISNAWPALLAPGVTASCSYLMLVQGTCVQLVLWDQVQSM